MRLCLVVCTLLLVATGQVPGATAQADEDKVLVEDATGDVEVEWSGVHQAPPQGYEHLDIVETWLGPEGPQTFEVGLRLAEWSPPANADTTYAFRGLYIHFTFGDQLYRVVAATCQDLPFTLGVASEGSRFAHSHVGCVDGTIDPETATIRAVVPKELIRDREGTPVRFGQEVTGLWARTYGIVGFVPVCTGAWNCTILAEDRAPDEGAPGQLPMTKGLQGVGHLQVSSPQPIRFSNGESTTLVYRLFVDNFGDADDVVFLESEGVEAGWDIRFPPRVAVSPGSTVEVPVILSFDFTHRHGETSTFNVTARSTVDETSHAWIRLGVHWPEIPQPAGHHNVLHVHSRSTYDADKPQLWINPLAEDPDPAADGAPIGQSSTYSNGTHTYKPWNVPLVPSLRIGLDFDLEGTGEAVFVFTADTPAQDIWVETRLWHCDPSAEEGGNGPAASCPGAWILLAEGRSEPAGMAANTPREFAMRITPTKAADLVPYGGPGGNLIAEVRLVGASGGILNPGSVPPSRMHPEGSWLDLPLLEYHDPVDQAYAGVGSLRLDALGPFEKPVNPGETVLFPFAVENSGEDKQDVRLTIEGYNLEWSRWAGASTFSLSPGQSRNVTLVIEAPIGSADGQRAELFAVAENAADPSIVSIARVRASVVEGDDVPDEADLVPSDTVVAPAAGLLWMFCAAAAAAVLATGRRKAA